MLIRTPTLDGQQIETWIRQGAEMVMPSSFELPAAVASTARAHAAFDFKKARQALQRARAKSGVRGIKPLRRLRTNQAAVNEGLLDAFGALLAINKSMAAELSAVSTELAELRARISRSAAADTRSTPETRG